MSWFKIKPTNIGTNETQLSKDLLEELKKLTKSDFKQLPAIDPFNGEELKGKFYNGLFTATSKVNAIKIVANLKNKFEINGYLIYYSETENFKPFIAVIKGKEELNILHYRRTDGINHKLANKDIVKKITDWKSKYGLSIIGCSRDWVHVEFEKLPTDLDTFAKEVYEFCPDSVDQGAGTIDKLKEAIVEMNGIYLWWD